MSKILAAVVALLIGGCATQSELAGSRAIDPIAAANTQRSRCFDAAMRGDAYQVIKGKIPEPGSSSVPFAMKADEQRPTEPQAAALMQFHGDLEPCRQRYLSAIAAANPLFGSVIGRYMGARDTEYLKLAQRKTTWGDFAQASDQINLAGAAEIARIRSDAQTVMAQAAAQWRPAPISTDSPGSGWNHPELSAPARTSRPTLTSCVWTGSILSCISD